MCFPDDPAGSWPQGDENAMKRTISVLLNNRFNDTERIIGLFSATGYKIEKMNLSHSGEAASRLVLVTNIQGKNIDNFLIRLRQQVRVSSVECAEGDRLPDLSGNYSTL